MTRKGIVTDSLEKKTTGSARLGARPLGWAGLTPRPE